MASATNSDDSFLAPPELAAALLPFGTSKAVAKGAMLFERGQQANGLFLIQSGSARLIIPGALDRRVVAGALLGVPGTLSKGPYSLSAELLEDSEVLFVPAELVTALLCKSPGIGFQLVQQLSREIHVLRQQIVSMNGANPRP